MKVKKWQKGNCLFDIFHDEKAVKNVKPPQAYHNDHTWR